MYIKYRKKSKGLKKSNKSKSLGEVSYLATNKTQGFTLMYRIFYMYNAFCIHPDPFIKEGLNLIKSRRR